MRRTINAVAALLILILLIASCSMLVITPSPGWLEGRWKLLDEDNIQIGECEISRDNITITITEWGYEEINLMDEVYQNGGWAEEEPDRYILYLGFDGTSCITFRNLGTDVEMQMDNEQNTTYFILTDRQ